MPDKRALVTGGAGFIGSHLSEKLLENGYRVHVIDDLSTGRRENVSHLEGDSRFRITVDTILKSDLMEKLISESDIVFHLAAAVGVEYVIKNQLKSLEINIRGSEIVLEHAGRLGTRVILFSTSEIYGKSDVVPFSEDADSILGPTTLKRWSYAVTKALDEILALAYHKEQGLPVVIVRLFNTCGPRQTGRYGMVLPRFVKQALAGEPLTVFGDGRQSRCFASVFDVVDGILRLVDCERAVGEIFNVGNNKETSIIGLAGRVKELTGSDSPIEFVEYEHAYGEGFEDMQRRVPDLRKIGEFVGYEPRIDLDGIIKSVIDFERK
ncbi:MAG: GDP-mannose 4,6-dehydratase [bacterium]|jgi:UDP-glucose 4-epimerase